MGWHNWQLLGSGTIAAQKTDVKTQINVKKIFLAFDPVRELLKPKSLLPLICDYCLVVSSSKLRVLHKNRFDINFKSDGKFHLKHYSF